MNSYKILSKQVYSAGNYSIVPIRMEDRYHIMRWRNEQMYHLRQNKPLTKEDQDKYFEDVVSKLFDQDKPDQILFSFLEGEKCIGYGGLVYINWNDRNAEISFVMDSALEQEYFEFHWTTYLKLLECAAFKVLKLHKLFVYAFDLRPHLYHILKNNNYFKDAVLKEHCLFQGKYIDVVIHAKLTPIRG
jgi:RimJ/RimL family protein N-acetyltransferase